MAILFMSVGAIFYRPLSASQIGRWFYFSFVDDMWIFKILNFDNFDSISPSKFLSVLKFWSNSTIFLVS
jgi:hypothetical protein